MKDTVFSGLEAPCCSGEADGCVCGDSERVLRGYIGGSRLPTMTPEQREWCLTEIGSVEGFARADYEQLVDADLARGVLDAWRSYCRDKGLL